MHSTKTLFTILALISLPVAYSQVSPAKSAAGILIQHVTIFDGIGQAPSEGDVRISGERIVAVAPHLQAMPGEEVLDKKGLALAPGFIDMHSHVSRGIFENPTADVMIRQGITTSLVGQDGESEFPLSDFFKRLDASPVALNLASMVGQGTIREQVMGKDLLRPSTAQELVRMKDLLTQEMRSGAFGLSTGLEYNPAHFSTTDEVVELSKVASTFGGFYISHVRDEGNKVFDSFHEITEIGERAAIPVEGDGYLTAASNNQLFLFDVETAKLDPLTTDRNFNDSDPVWSPDGKRIAYVSNHGKDSDRTGTDDIFLIDARAAATPQKLDNANEPGGRFAWSPDGKLLAYLEGSEPKYKAYNQNRLAVIPVAGGPSRVFTEKLDRGVSSLEFTVDGSAITFLVTDDQHEYAAKVPVSGGCGTQKFNPSGIDDGEVGFSVRFDLLQWIRSIGGF